jgi:hypothetical protein
MIIIVYYGNNIIIYTQKNGCKEIYVEIFCKKILIG